MMMMMMTTTITTGYYAYDNSDIIDIMRVVP